jgi:integrative and conjugative element protein (TIGR02256 family)
MICSSPDGSICIQLKSEAKRIIEQDIAKFHPYETGGILIGAYNENLKLATIYSATSSSIDSKHGYTSFDRGTDNILESIEKVKISILASLHYLGEWHSHPNNSPKPSGQDLKQMQKFAKNKLHGIRSPLLLIVGGIPMQNLLWQFSLHRHKKSTIYFDQV